MVLERTVNLWLADIFLFLRELRNQSKGIKHKTPNKISGKRSLHTIKHKLFNRLLNAINFFRTTTVALTKRSLKHVADVLRERLSLPGKIFKNVQS